MDESTVAREFLRAVTGGTASHTDHARRLALLLKKVGGGSDCRIKDEGILRAYTRLYGVEEAGRAATDVALDLAGVFLGEFMSQEAPLKTLALAPAPQNARWQNADVVPLGIDRMLVESMHRTHAGVDPDCRSLLCQAFKTSLSDGWGAGRIASIVSDICSMPDDIPKVAGLNVATIKYVLGGTYRASLRPLNDAVMQGRIKGVVGIVGCQDLGDQADDYIDKLTSMLVGSDVLVVRTGRAAVASAVEGMLTQEEALAGTGAGLREVCEAVGMPPVLYMGSCADSTRILEVCAGMVREGGLGDDISQLPVVGCAPEWVNDEVTVAGCYCVASGLDVILGNARYVGSAPNVVKFLTREAVELFGGGFHISETPEAAFELAMKLIEARRAKLGVNRKAERKLFDMKDRRAHHV